MTGLQAKLTAIEAVAAIPVYRAIAQDIRALGITTVFGLMSDDTAMLVNALEDVGVRFVMSRHENNACAMAEGYSWATQTLGVALIGRGPAAANCINGAIHASRTGARVLIIYGDASTAGRNGNGVGPDLKGLDAVRLLEGAGLTTFRATSSAAARSVLIDAATAANRGGTVALLLPTDVQQGKVENGDAPEALSSRSPAAPALRVQGIDLAVAALARARKPLIVAGWGAYLADARAEIERLADATGAILATSLKGKDFFKGHPFDVGIIGSFSHSVGRRLIDQADCVIVIGAGLNALTTNWGDAVPAGVPLIHIDNDRSAIGKYWFADVAVIGDARAISAALADRLEGSARAESLYRTDENRDLIARFDHRDDFRPAATRWAADPRSIGLALNELLPANRNVVMDVGNFFGVVPYIDVPGPGHLKYSSDFGSIGLGFGTALGVACARPDAPTVLFIGDGSLLMTMGELATVASEELPLIIIVMNDSAYGAERHYLELRDHRPGKSMFPMIDFAPVAEAFGFEVATVNSEEDLKALAPRFVDVQSPLLIDIKINPAVQAPFMGEFARAEGYGPSV